MAKNGAQGTGRLGEVEGRSRPKNPANGLWTYRDTSTTRFASTKAKGGPFKGVKREGGHEWGWPDTVLCVLLAPVVLLLVAVVAAAMLGGR